jgi:hypothetical protein
MVRTLFFVCFVFLFFLWGPYCFWICFWLLVVCFCICPAYPSQKFGFTYGVLVVPIMFIILVRDNRHANMYSVSIVYTPRRHLIWEINEHCILLMYVWNIVVVCVWRKYLHLTNKNGKSRETGNIHLTWRPIISSTLVIIGYDVRE